MAKKQVRDSKGRFGVIHGIYSKRKDRRYVDGRYGPAKAINNYIEALAAEAGGLEQLDPTQHGMLGNIRMTLITLCQISEHIAGLDSIIKDNCLIPIVAKGQSTYQRDLQRFLKEYRETLDGKNRGRVPTLEDWIDQQENEN